MTVRDLFRTLVDSGISLDTEIKAVSQNAEAEFDYHDFTTVVVDYDDGTAGIIVRESK